jgi:mannose-6-phosphate isomerase-like protein (cupin superfamily)
MTPGAHTEQGETTTSDPVRIRVLDALKNIPNRDGQWFSEVFCHGTLSAEIYTPKIADTQSRHARDEVYIVLQGEGRFYNGKDRHPFAPGDLLFVPAGVEHRFEDFTDDTTLWVIFFGPDGGETGRSHTSA